MECHRQPNSQRHGQERNWVRRHLGGEGVIEGYYRSDFFPLQFFSFCLPVSQPFESWQVLLVKEFWLNLLIVTYLLVGLVENLCCHLLLRNLCELMCLLWIEKVRYTEKTYKWGSVWWETKHWLFFQKR
jgi:hypothetical protein